MLPSTTYVLFDCKFAEYVHFAGMLSSDDWWRIYSRIKRRLLIVLILAVFLKICFHVVLQRSSASPGFQYLYDREPELNRPRVDSRTDVLNELPNLPAAYSNFHFVRSQYYLNRTCAHYPGVFQLAFNNLYWQKLYSSDGTWYLFGAYYENRSLSEMKPAVRLLAMVDRYEPTVTPHCQIWFPQQRSPLIVRVAEINYMWNRGWGVKNSTGTLHPYLITCPVPQTHSSLVPDSVSLVEHVCDVATNHMRVIYNQQQPKRDFVVCVKALNFVEFDYSVRLIEWIELVHILGADKIVMHYLHNHENVEKVLRYYEQKGIVELVPYSLAGDQPNLPLLRTLYLGHGTYQKRLSEMISLNDCVYKNMYNYEYLVVMDVDEILIPVQLYTWQELVAEVRRQVPPESVTQSFFAFNVLFYDDDTHPTDRYRDIPPYLHMLQHVLRNTTFDRRGKSVKGFHETSRIKVMHNHMPISCLGSRCRSYSMDKRDVQLQHYCHATLKTTCMRKNSNASTLDTIIWRYKRELIERTMPVLSELGFLE